MFDRIVSDIICSTFRKLDLTWGGCHPKGPNKDKTKRGLLISFNVEVDYDKEDGCRNVYLLIYADANYVGVYEKERWDVTPKNDHHSRNSDQTEWTCLGYHDSCWTETIHRFLLSRLFNKNRRCSEDRDKHAIEGIDTLWQSGGWYSLIEINEELQMKLRKVRERNK